VAAIGPQPHGMNLWLLVDYDAGVLLLDRVLLGLRQRNAFLSFANGRVAHEVLETGRGEDGYQVDGVASQVVDRNPCTSRAASFQERIRMLRPSASPWRP
jgi:hypothetical protein